jgi:hypothetical protein
VIEDPLETAMLSGTVTALRRRAARQRQIAKDRGDRSGEAAIALRIATTLETLAAEFEGERAH